MQRHFVDIFSSAIALLLLLTILSVVISDVVGSVATKRKTKTVKIKSGLEDATAFVGQFFNYTLPSDAFVGEVAFYQVLEAGMDELPSWLLWDNQTLSLYGVPDEEDLGPHYVAVTAVGAPMNDTHTSLAKDVFTVEVRHDGSRHFKFGQQQQRQQSSSDESKVDDDADSECRGKDITVASVLLNVSLSTLKPKQRVAVLQSVSNLFEIPLFRLRLLNLDYFETTFRQSEAYLSTANVDESQQQQEQQQHLESKNRKNALLLFILGCRNNAESDTSTTLPPPASFPLVEKLRVAMAQNTFNAALYDSSASPLDLHVASGQFSPKKRRRHARQLNPSPYGRTTAETDMPSLPTRPPVVTVVRLLPTSRTTTPTTTVFRPLYPPTTTSRPTNVATQHRTSSRRTTAAPTTFTSEKIASTKKTTEASTTFARASTTKLTTTQLPTTTLAAVTMPPTKKPGDSRPVLRSGLGSITCYKGVLCEHQISPFTFEDDEDGDTTHLQLELHLLNNTREDWLTLDKTNQKLIGLPLLTDGTFPYRVTASDSSNNAVSDAFEINVKPSSLEGGEQFNHQFILTLKLNYESFKRNSRQQITFVRRLASALGEPNATHVTVVGVQSGSTVIHWANNTLATKRCDGHAINATVSEMRTTTFRDRMGAEFPVSNVAVEYTGNCVSGKLLEPALVVPPSGTVPPSSKTPGVVDKTSDIFIATILPAIIIVVLLLIAIAVACVLYKRNKKTKQASDESKSEFVSKGVPVIFSDEVDAEKESMAATPMLLKDEKPPLQPADFAHTNGNGHHHHQHQQIVGSQPTSLKSTTFGKKPMSSVEETELTSRPLLQDFDENPLYRPPPPFEPSRIDSRSPRPKHASPQQREPPPYVPP